MKSVRCAGCCTDHCDTDNEQRSWFLGKSAHNDRDMRLHNMEAGLKRTKDQDDRCNLTVSALRVIRLSFRPVKMQDNVT